MADVWQARPQQWQPNHQWAAADAATFYFAKSSQDFGLGVLPAVAALILFTNLFAEYHFTYFKDIRINPGAYLGFEIAGANQTISPVFPINRYWV